LNIGNEHESIPLRLTLILSHYFKKNDSDISNNNTSIIHNHDIMSYCYYVKPSDDIPQELLEKYDIQTDPVIFRGDQSFDKGDVAKKFMEEIIKVSIKIENMLKVNVPLTRSAEDNIKHRSIVDLGTYPLCKSKFNNNNNLPARDHDHLTGKYRGTTATYKWLNQGTCQFFSIIFLAMIHILSSLSWVSIQKQ